MAVLTLSHICFKTARPARVSFVGAGVVTRLPGTGGKCEVVGPVVPVH